MIKIKIQYVNDDWIENSRGGKEELKKYREAQDDPEKNAEDIIASESEIEVEDGDTILVEVDWDGGAWFYHKKPDGTKQGFSPE